MGNFSHLNRSQREAFIAGFAPYWRQLATALSLNVEDYVPGGVYATSYDKMAMLAKILSDNRIDFSTFLDIVSAINLSGLITPEMGIGTSRTSMVMPAPVSYPRATSSFVIPATTSMPLPTPEARTSSMIISPAAQQKLIDFKGIPRVKLQRQVQVFWDKLAEEHKKDYAQNIYSQVPGGRAASTMDLADKLLYMLGASGMTIPTLASYIEQVYTKYGSDLAISDAAVQALALIGHPVSSAPGSD